MNNKPIRLYTLYSDGRNRYVSFYRHEPYMIDVRAVSIRQAIFLAANRRLSPDGKAVGIVEVDHNDGPRFSRKFFGDIDVPNQYIANAEATQGFSGPDSKPFVRTADGGE
jgi:hypothetical protein